MKPQNTPPSKTRLPGHTIFGQPSWRLTSDQVEAFVTRKGGHLGPVTFQRRKRKLRPYSVAPWAEEPVGELPTILKALRGDFFCLPFGGNSTPFNQENHPVHGETANSNWKFEALETEGGTARLHLSLRTKIRPGRVDKRISLLPNQNVLYCDHTITGMRGPMCPGHHAMLRFPDAPGSGLLSTSRMVFGQVFPGTFESPENGGYSTLKPGAEFSSLDSVPTANGETADLSRFPARRGFEDLVLLVSDPALPFAWTAVAFPKERYVWFALKDPRVLRQTVLWLSNGGRHYPPWSGRHIGVMGLEEVTACFHYGLAESARENDLSRKGYPTCLQLEPAKPLSIRYIMGIADIPVGFNHVASIAPAAAGNAVTLRSANGKEAKASLNLDFLNDRGR